MPQQTFGVGTVPLVLKVGERVTLICSSGCAGFISVPGEAVAQTITAGSMYDYGGYSVQREAVPRKRRVIDIYGNSSFYFAGIRTTGVNTVWAAPAQPTMAIIGDSYTGGSSGNAGSYTSPSMDTALQDAAASVAGYGSRLLYVPTLNDPMGPWQYGGLSTGNFSIYGNTGDGTHMLEPGYEYLGNRAIDAVRKAILRAAA